MSVIIYSTPSCGYCNVAKKYFKENKINFTDYNVMIDTTKAQEMISKSGQRGVPVIDINGKIIIGFNRPEIEKSLKR
ncbi:MAG: glutaredoxin domain-containing protein [Spirochaetaceae bacterium]|jgi:glutaredoxin 3|nr:glutaredoxin domain-containing protein [Spirochaetaceae bacterium]